MRATIVVDLGFGDSGKGTLTDFLAREQNADVVVRYNGGAQAGHNVVLPDGTHHEFRQFGSAMFVPGVRTHLSRFMLLNPLMLFEEESQLQRKGVTDAFQRLSFDADTIVTTPFHIAANRVREVARGRERHGSVGLGIGETRKDQLEGRTVVRVRDFYRPDELRKKLTAIREAKLREVSSLISRLPAGAANIHYLPLTQIGVTDELVDIYTTLGRIVPAYEAFPYESFDHVIFEGAQGVLLDEWRGFFPYVTWTACTPDNAVMLLREQGLGAAASVIGVTRAYMTRHGAGPFVTEDEAVAFDEPHNVYGAWQGSWRQGWTDLVALRYAMRACRAWAPDVLAVTHLDRVKDLDSWKMCAAYTTPLSVVRTDFDPPAMKDDERKWADRQQRLTSLLMKCDPVCHELDAGRIDDRICSAIERATDREVAIRSYGPTFEDKQRVGALIS